jgi:uncharacterized protein (DUF924 family)
MEELLQFWFAHRDDWWSRSAAFDEELRRRFGRLRDEVQAGAHEDWRETGRGALAYVIALDQLSRNLFRDDRRAFEADAQALRAARAAIDRGEDARLSLDERVFLYMPFMHSESMDDQERSVQLFRVLGEPLEYAERHRDVIRRFGRFPHRNAALGRASTAEELEFLRQPGSSFG